tara:strand:- start:88 stop:681 length:594 start_codon:yes stop_codon:yes gene_type:complete
MAERTQLNVNIRPELLKSLKHKAIKSGMTLANYVTKIVKDYISKEDLDNEDNILNSRIESIEDQLEKLVNQLNVLNSTKNEEAIKPTLEVTGFSEEGAKSFGIAVSKLFKEECEIRALSTQEAVIELTPHIQSTFNIKYWGPLTEMFAENKILTTPDLMYEIYKDHGDKCPMFDLFYKWCGKEPQLIESHFEQAILH